MRGICGLTGWQWLFLVSRLFRIVPSILSLTGFVQIEGLFSILVGLIFTFFFPISPANPACYAKFCYFNEQESEILISRILSDDPSKEHSRKNISRSEIIRTVCHAQKPQSLTLLICLGHELETLSAYVVDYPWFGALVHAVVLRAHPRQLVGLPKIEI